MRKALGWSSVGASLVVGLAAYAFAGTRIAGIAGGGPGDLERVVVFSIWLTIGLVPALALAALGTWLLVRSRRAP